MWYQVYGAISSAVRVYNRVVYVLLLADMCITAVLSFPVSSYLLYNAIHLFRVYSGNSMFVVYLQNRVVRYGFNHLESSGFKINFRFPS